MPQYLQCDTKKLRLILDKIKRYYSITQNELKCSSSISRKYRHISEETVAELKRKMLEVSKEIKLFVKYLSDNKERYTKQKKSVLSRESRKDIVSGKLNDFSSDLYKNLVLVETSFSKNESTAPVQLTIINKITDIADEFESALGRLSDDIFSLKIASSAFSLSRHSELLSVKYERNYENCYNRNRLFSLGILYAIKMYFRTSTRAEEIDFLSNKLSLHPSCNDVVRHNAFLVVIQKIDDCKAKNSILRDLLETGRYCSVIPEHEHIPPCEMLDNFCSKHHIKIPGSLSVYINNQRDSLEETRFLIDHSVDYGVNLSCYKPR